MKPKLHELTDRWAAMLLVLVLIFLLFAGPLSQKADAVVVSSVIVGAVIATMALAGITFVASGMTAAQLQDWVSEKLDEWAADLGSPLDHLINSAGIGVTISGLLTVGTAAAQGINQFITWMKTELGLSDNDTVSVQQATDNLNGQYIIYPVPYTFGNGSQAISVSGDPGYVYIYYRSESSNYPTLYYVSTVQNAAFRMTQTNLTGIYYCNELASPYYWCTSYSFNNNVLQVPRDQMNDVPLGTALGLNPTINSTGSLSLETGVITVPQVQNDDKVFLDVGALPGSTVTEVTEGVISDAVTNTLDVSGEVAESEPEYVIDGPEPVYGLADVFPFCIPFDLYDFVSCLAADPVAPHFEWRLYVEDLVDYTFVIDLQQFETVAQIFRTMFLLAFIIGLAMVTRHLLRS